VTEARAPDPLQGVFSTTLVVDGAPVELHAHLARLAASVRELYGAELPAVVEARARAASRGRALACLRLTATPDGAGGVRAAANAEPLERAMVLPGAAGAIELRAVALDRWPAAHKWVDRSALHELHARSRPALPLLVGRDGSVRETFRGNVFALGADGVLRTPPADGAILPGVARAQLIELARESGIEVREQPLSLAQLARAREAFASNSVRGIEPVRSLGGCDFPVLAGLAQDLTRALAERWSLRHLDRGSLRH